MNRALSLALLVSLSGVPCFAQTAAVPSTDPLSQTQELLKNPKAREAVIQGDPNAEKADHYVKGLGLSQQNQDSVYGLSGDILKTLVDQSGGDSAQLERKVQEYLRNPSAIEKDLTPEQKKRIHDLSVQTPQGRPTQLDSGLKP